MSFSPLIHTSFFSHERLKKCIESLINQVFRVIIRHMISKKSVYLVLTAFSLSLLAVPAGALQSTLAQVDIDADTFIQETRDEVEQEIEQEAEQEAEQEQEQEQ